MKNIGAGVAVALMGTVPGPSIADVKDYEVIRFLYLKTSCGRSTNRNARLWFALSCRVPGPDVVS